MSPRSTAEWRAMNEPVIAEFRARGGRVSRKYPVLLLTTIGARSGQPRITPLNFSVDGDRLVVIASAGRETFQARATTAEEPERTRLFDQQAAAMSFFGGYRRRVRTRQIPVVVFEAEPGVVRRALETV